MELSHSRMGTFNTDVRVGGPSLSACPVGIFMRGGGRGRGVQGSRASESKRRGSSKARQGKAYLTYNSLTDTNLPCLVLAGIVRYLLKLTKLGHVGRRSRRAGNAKCAGVWIEARHRKRGREGRDREGHRNAKADEKGAIEKGTESGLEGRDREGHRKRTREKGTDSRREADDDGARFDEQARRPRAQQRWRGTNVDRNHGIGAPPWCAQPRPRCT